MRYLWICIFGGGQPVPHLLPCSSKGWSTRTCIALTRSVNFKPFQNPGEVACASRTDKGQTNGWTQDGQIGSPTCCCPLAVSETGWPCPGLEIHLAKRIASTDVDRGGEGQIGLAAHGQGEQADHESHPETWRHSGKRISTFTYCHTHNISCLFTGIVTHCAHV